MIKKRFKIQVIHAVLALGLLLAGCQAQTSSGFTLITGETPAAQESGISEMQIPLPYPTRPLYQPGELVDYTAQTGDTLEQIAAHFNTTTAEILQANTFIPAGATTMPPGMPMKIPIYYLPLWGSPYRILPDGLFINGPAQVGFDTRGYVAGQKGWLRDYQEYASDANRSGAEIVEYIAQKYSLSPRLLLAMLEFQSKALSDPNPSPDTLDYALGNRSWQRKGLFSQLNWAANLLNNGYYRYRTSDLLEIELQDERLERFDPWINAATASLHNYYNTLYAPEKYLSAISEDGLAKTYSNLFGDPWQNEQPHIPGSLSQPEFWLPFEPGQVWAYTGGPHSAWGNGAPLAALDFAPPAVAGGCIPTELWATAIADGLVVRSGTGEVVVDLDGDGDDRTGWNIFYLHLATEGRAQAGTDVKRGQPVGHPSCEGGTSTGTHVHIARKYNGEWIPAEGIGGVLAFNMEGWLPHDGDRSYEGTLTRENRVVVACTCSNQKSFIYAEPR